jgi:hypothetical protein
MRFEKPKSFYSAYVKAGLVFAASTAAFLLAKTMGFLPKWSGSELEGGNDTHRTLSEDTYFSLAETESPFTIPDSVLTIPILEASQDVSSLIVQQEDFSFLDPPVSTQSALLPRRLLQTGSDEVTVANPIPDQVIDAALLYRYDLSWVFWGNDLKITATLANGSALPDWLSLNYLALQDYAASGFIYAVQIRHHTAYVGGLGFEVLDLSATDSITQLGEYTAWPSDKNVLDIEIMDDTAYLTRNALNIAQGGLEILNVSDPMQIVYLGHYNGSGAIYSLQVAKSLAYLGWQTWSRGGIRHCRYHSSQRGSKDQSS